MKAAISKFALAVLLIGTSNSAFAQDADVNAKDKDGMTVLMHTAENGSLDHLKALIAKGADVNAKDKVGKTALVHASNAGHNDCVKNLVAAHADLNTQDNLGATALIQAVRKSKVDCVSTLIGAGADVNLKDIAGNTALMEAVVKGNADVFKALTSAHAELIPVLKVTDLKARSTMADGFVKIGAPAIDPLADLLENQDVDVQQAAAKALSGIKDPRAESAIKYEQVNPRDLQITFKAAIINATSRNGGAPIDNSIDGTVAKFSVGDTDIELTTDKIGADNFRIEADNLDLPFKLSTKRFGTIRLGFTGGLRDTNANVQSLGSEPMFLGLYGYGFDLWLLPCQKRDLLKLLPKTGNTT